MPITHHVIVVGAYATNCYLVWDSETLDGVIIDPGDDAHRIKTAVEQAGITPRAVLLTHGHPDHVGAVLNIRKQFDLKVYAGKGEENLLATFGISDAVVAPANRLSDEQLIKHGSLTLRVLATPGHSPGGLCFLAEREGIIYCGDTLFARSVGRTDFAGGSTEALLNSINTKILTLPDSVVCMPGHGPQTTVGAERNGNPFLTGTYFV